MKTQCLGITKKKKRCKRYASNNGYCHQHTDQDLSDKCLSLDIRGVRCMIPKHFDNKCSLHMWNPNWKEHLLAINHKEVLLTTLGNMEVYFNKHRESKIFPRHCYNTYLTKEVSLTRIDVLIDLINEFIGIDYIWIVIGQRYGSLSIDIVGVDCEHNMKKASIYYVKIDKVYERSNLESRRIIT